MLTPVFGPLPQLVNIPKSKVYGFEANLVLRPAKGLRLSSGLTYVRSKVRRDPVAVSYTHLDVYKRQSSPIPNGTGKCAPGASG